MKIVLLGVIGLFMLGFPAAASAGVVCPKAAGYIAGPFVPTEEVARKIYLAVAAQYRPESHLREFSIIAVEDEGASWVVTETSRPRKVIPNPGTVVERFGGGMLRMRIDKCTGAISDAYYTR